MRTARTIYACIFLLLVLSPMAVVLMSKIQESVVQYQMRELLEERELTTLHITKPQLKWYKPGKELLIGTNLFDVKSIKETSTGFVVTGLFDDKEKQLKQHLKALAAEEDQKNGEENLPAFHSWYFEDRNNVSILHHADGRLCRFPFYKEHLQYRFYPVIILPPEFSLVV